jgi:hypothetical protein
MRTSSAKAKGRRLQDETKNAILKAFPDLEPDDVKCAIMGESGTDIKLSPAARKKFPYAVECKNVEKLNIWSALEQANENTPENQTSLLIFKRNRSDTFVALPLSHFISLVQDKQQKPILLLEDKPTA